MASVRVIPDAQDQIAGYKLPDDDSKIFGSAYHMLTVTRYVNTSNAAAVTFVVRGDLMSRYGRDAVEWIDCICGDDDQCLSIGTGRQELNFARHVH